MRRAIASAALAVAVLATPGPARAATPAPTAEDARLVAAGLLPADFAAELADPALARRGLAGPFSKDFGDPASMRAAARYAADHPEYARLLHALRRGDLVLIARNDPHQFIARLTGGPFVHALICTDAAPPGHFIEAVGITSEGEDPVCDQVRRCSASRYATDTATFRLMRPVEQLPPARRAEAIERTIAWAAAQLGKPYNYTFSDRIGGDRAYYCSSFVLRAYEAGGVQWPLHKDAARDRLLLAVRRAVLALGPDDPLGLSVGFMRFVHTHPTPEAFARYVVTEVLPHTRRTAGLVATDGERVRLERAIARDLAARRPAALAGDLTALVARRDLDPGRALDACGAVLGATWPYADDLAAYLAGPTAAPTRLTGEALDLLERLGLPGHAPYELDTDFTSPSDVAWASLPHEDFNVRPGFPLDPPWPYAVVGSR